MSSDRPPENNPPELAVVSPRLYLSKSDFKVARTCPTKLFYKKSRYPNLKDVDPYMQLLADGGFMVGKWAQILYPAGHLVSTLDPEQAAIETDDLLAADSVTLFEPCIREGARLARVDVLVKEGNRFQLIEVKAKAGDSAQHADGLLFRGKRGEVRAGWGEYLEDIAYQRSILVDRFPQADVRSFLMLLDKRARTSIDGAVRWFRLRRRGRSTEVEFTGDAEAIRRDGLVHLFPVDREMEMLDAEVRVATSSFLPFLRDGLKKPPPEIGYHCRTCEFRCPAGQTGQDGFRECWGALADPAPHLFDLYKVGVINGGPEYAAELIAAGRTSLLDIDPARCGGGAGVRQRIQIDYTREGREWVGPGIAEKLASLEYPLHFIDFETSRTAIPYHEGMRPYGLVAFQWSCHTLRHEAGDLEHSEWINVADAQPNAEFARTLKATLGDTGTVLTWSKHETTCLREIAETERERGVVEGDLLDWLRDLTAEGGRIFDLWELALRHYFHPRMAGSTSLKAVLPAVLEANPGLKSHRWFAADFTGPDGTPISDPYKTLPPIDILARAEVIQEGTGAMRAYQAMLYGEEGLLPDVVEGWRRLLLQYCRLDTLAMVVVWKHWNETRFGQNG